MLLYELTTGRLPFDGDTYMSIVFKHVNEPAPPPRTVNPDLPEAVEQIIQKAMAKDPAQRYASAHELLTAVEALTSGQTLPTPASEPTRLFICYKHQTDPDQELAGYLYETLTSQGHDVFIDPVIRTDEAGLKQVDQQIKSSDFFIILLSQEAADSEIIQSQIGQAYHYFQTQGQPRLLPVRIAPGNVLPYAIPPF
jgi:serine/threonine protein kinase